MSARRGWYGCDFDGTLVHYDGWVSPAHAGAPIVKMVERIRQHLKDGDEVRIVTARIYPYTKVLMPGTPMAVGDTEPERNAFISACTIATFCREQFDQVLPITCMKDYGMIRLYDDRCAQVAPNEGYLLEEVYRESLGYTQFLIDSGYIPLDEDGGFTFPDGMRFTRTPKSLAA